MSTLKTNDCSAQVAIRAVDRSSSSVGTPRNVQPGVGVTVERVMLDKSRFPVLAEQALLKETLEKMSLLNLGIACLTNSHGILTGIITDGDIRRKLLTSQKPFSAFFVDDAINHAIKNPITVFSTQSLAHAVKIMGEKRVWDLPVVGADGRLQGLLHLHPAIEAMLGEFNCE